LLGFLLIYFSIASILILIVLIIFDKIKTLKFKTLLIILSSLFSIFFLVFNNEASAAFGDNDEIIISADSQNSCSKSKEIPFSNLFEQAIKGDFKSFNDLAKQTNIAPDIGGKASKLDENNLSYEYVHQTSYVSQKILEDPNFKILATSVSALSRDEVVYLIPKDANLVDFRAELENSKKGFVYCEPMSSL
jgi:hypothetical protein